MLGFAEFILYGQFMGKCLICGEKKLLFHSSGVCVRYTGKTRAKFGDRSAGCLMPALVKFIHDLSTSYSIESKNANLDRLEGSSVYNEFL